MYNDSFGGTVVQGVTQAGENLAGFAGHAVYYLNSLVVPLSLTDQATTEQIAPLGILITEANTAAAGYIPDVVVAQDGVRVPFVAGATVNPGDEVKVEYSATPANRGRFLAIDPSDELPGTVVVGICRSPAAVTVGLTGVLEVKVRRINLAVAPE